MSAFVLQFPKETIQFNVFEILYSLFIASCHIHISSMHSLLYCMPQICLKYHTNVNYLLHILYIYSIVLYDKKLQSKRKYGKITQYCTMVSYTSGVYISCTTIILSKIYFLGSMCSVCSWIYNVLIFPWFTSDLNSINLFFLYIATFWYRVE